MTIEDRSIKFYFKDLQLGPKGDPGVSPTISVYDIENGHRVALVDAEGAHYFNVTNGISPPYTPNPIGNWLFDQEKDDLLKLTPSGTFDTEATVKLDHSRIVHMNADATDLNTTRAWFTMTGEPRYLGTSIETTDFEDSDFKEFTINQNYNLYCHISGVQTLSPLYSGTVALPACYFYIALRGDRDDTIYLTLITPTISSATTSGTSSSLRNATQTVEYLMYVPIADYIPNMQAAKKIAVAVGVFPGLFNFDMLVDFYVKKNEFGLTANDNRYTIAYCNNGDIAEKAYVKGEYFIRQNMLFRVLQDISSGGQFVNNVNVIQTNIADEMKEVRETAGVLL